MNGTLTIYLIFSEPQSYTDEYQLKNRLWQLSKTSIAQVSCDEEHAHELVAMWRGKNENVPHEAVWVGPHTL